MNLGQIVLACKPQIVRPRIEFTKDLALNMTTNNPLHNQVALVTGGGKRIGRAIALALGRAGADVIVNYHQSREGAHATAREITAMGVRAVALRADVTSSKQVTAMFAAIKKRFGRLDLLVNNAGVFFPKTWDELEEKDFDRVLGANLKGPFFCAQAAARMMMRQGGGNIVNISSLGGLQSWPSYMHYCASKAALISLTKTLAKALAPAIRVNSVAPGTIRFPGEETNARVRKMIQAIPLRQAGTADDIAETVLFLAAHSDFITGQVFVVDGGKSIP